MSCDGSTNVLYVARNASWYRKSASIDTWNHFIWNRLLSSRKKTRFSQKLSNLELSCLSTTYRKSYTGFSKNPSLDPQKSTMAEIRHLENRHDIIFFCWGWSYLDKISETGAEWHVDCGNVEIDTRCRIPIWRTFGRIQWHVIPEPPATLQGAVTGRLRCHDSRATCYIAGCCHLANSMTCHSRATCHFAG